MGAVVAITEDAGGQYPLAFFTGLALAAAYPDQVQVALGVLHCSGYAVAHPDLWALAFKVHFLFLEAAAAVHTAAGLVLKAMINVFVFCPSACINGLELGAVLFKVILDAGAKVFKHKG